MFALAKFFWEHIPEFEERREIFREPPTELHLIWFYMNYLKWFWGIEDRKKAKIKLQQLLLKLRVHYVTIMILIDSKRADVRFPMIMLLKSNQPQESSIPLTVGKESTNVYRYPALVMFLLLVPHFGKVMMNVFTGCYPFQPYLWTKKRKARTKPLPAISSELSLHKFTYA